MRGALINELSSPPAVADAFERQAAGPGGKVVVEL
jgi:hypothetical protein